MALYDHPLPTLDSLLNPYKVNAVAEWQYNILYPTVVADIVIERNNLLRLLVLASNLLDNLTVP